jgi:hypothetical protein
MWGTVVLLLVVVSSPAAAQSRDTTRERLDALLTTAGQRSDVNVAFRLSTKNPYNFIGTMSTGLTNADELEIVISVTKSDTIGFRVYPHYHGTYVNVGKARDGPALMRALLHLSDLNFLFWGADDSDDIFCGYTVTLESGFPSDAIVIVLRSIHNTDKFVGQLRPFIDGTLEK